MNNYIINLDSRQDRLKNIKKQLEKHGYTNFKRVPAMEGTPPWVYCGLSHQKILRENQSNSNILIMEDDCTFSDDFMIRWTKIKKWLDDNPTKWDIFNGSPVIKKVLKTKVITREPLLLQVKETLSTNFIYYNEMYINTILKWVAKDGFYDTFYNRDKDIRILTTVPYFVKQTEDFSDIEQKNVNYSTLYYTSQKILNLFI